MIRLPRARLRVDHRRLVRSAIVSLAGAVVFFVGEGLERGCELSCGLFAPVDAVLGDEADEGGADDRDEGVDGGGSRERGPLVLHLVVHLLVQCKHAMMQGALTSSHKSWVHNIDVERKRLEQRHGVLAPHLLQHN